MKCKLIVATLVLGLSLTACGDKGQSGEYIDLVKYDINHVTKDDTIVQFLDKWDICTDGYWRLDEQNEKAAFVSYTCEFDAKGFRDKAFEYYDKTLKSKGIDHQLDISLWTQKLDFVVIKEKKEISPKAITTNLTWSDGRTYEYMNVKSRDVLSMASTNTPNLTDEAAGKKDIKELVGTLMYYYKQSKVGTEK